MSAYVISIVKIKDRAKFRLYRQLAAPSLIRYNARPIAVVDPHRLLGKDQNDPGAIAGATWPVVFTTVVEFPSLEEAHRWHDSPEYCAAKDFRKQAADVTIAIVDGYDWPLSNLAPPPAPALMAS